VIAEVSLRSVRGPRLKISIYGSGLKRTCMSMAEMSTNEKITHVRRQAPIARERKRKERVESAKTCQQKIGKRGRGKQRHDFVALVFYSLLDRVVHP
jgi:hypothetical protein